jgi:hypothetical protein
MNRWHNNTALHPRRPEFSQSISYLEYTTLDELAPTDVVLCVCVTHLSTTPVLLLAPSSLSLAVLFSMKCQMVAKGRSRRV